MTGKDTTSEESKEDESENKPHKNYRIKSLKDKADNSLVLFFKTQIDVECTLFHVVAKFFEELRKI